MSPLSSVGADVSGLVVITVVPVPVVVASAGAGSVVTSSVAPFRAGPPTTDEVIADTGLDEPDRVVEPVLVVVADVVGVDADAEVVPADAACRGCTSPDTSDVTVLSGAMPAVVSVAWLLGSGGSVSPSAWATPTPRSIKPPASNPAWMDRFTQVRMRNLSKFCWGRSVISAVSGCCQPMSVSA
ncbi:hypothetical protein [Amycolatopsis sp. NPDC049868]|uniref:hypothetical protein n=1 Tax=Amycolatopsis sp. NPDC049868 TaxID=3363934 RepID=UPI0037B20402